jgi:hypothetical protein
MEDGRALTHQPQMLSTKSNSMANKNTTVLEYQMTKYFPCQSQNVVIVLIPLNGVQVCDWQVLYLNLAWESTKV